MRDRGIGRGLAAILQTDEVAAGGGEFREIPIELITPNPDQPRKTFDQTALSALSNSIAERGIIQPIIVRECSGRYELIAGERRWRAAQIAGLATVPAVVRSDEDSRTLELALIENMAREDLNLVEQAQACALLVEEFGLTREEVGRRVGRSRVGVSNLLRLLDLPDEVLDLLVCGALTEGHGRALLLADDHDVRRQLGKRATSDGWTVRETERQARVASDRSNQPGGSANEQERQEWPHPDQIVVAEEIAAIVCSRLGVDAKVRPKDAGYKVTFTVRSADELAS